MRKSMTTCNYLRSKLNSLVNISKFCNEIIEDFYGIFIIVLNAIMITGRKSKETNAQYFR